MKQRTIYLSSSGYWATKKHTMMMMVVDNDDENIGKAYSLAI
jgi:hypothetical protein